MKQVLCSAISLALMVSVTQASAAFDLIGTYKTGLADIAEELTAGETAALRGNRLYVTNASDVSLDIVDVSKPAKPRLIRP